MRSSLAHRNTRPAWREDERLALIHDLRDGECLVCREAFFAQRNWATWYTIETHADPGYRDRIARDGGFCPGHLRQLMSRADGRELLAGLFADIISHRLALPSDATAIGYCDTCDKVSSARRRCIETVTRWLGEVKVRNALSGGQLCLPHLLDLLRTAPWPHVAHLTALTSDLLTSLLPAELTGVLAGTDSDLLRRRTFLVAAHAILGHEDKEAARMSTLDKAVSEVERACCAICRAGARYSWLCTRGTTRLDPGETRLCARHLHDASTLDHHAAETVAVTMRDTLLGRLNHLTEHLATTPRITVFFLGCAQPGSASADTTPRTPCPLSSAPTTTSPRPSPLSPTTRPPARAVRQAPCREDGNSLCWTPHAMSAPSATAGAVVLGSAWNMRHNWPTRSCTTLCAATSTYWPRSWTRRCANVPGERATNRRLRQSRRAIPLICGGSYLGCTAEEYDMMEVDT